MEKIMKVLYIGNQIEESKFATRKNYEFTSYADNFMQNCLLEELRLGFGADLHTITINIDNNKERKKGLYNKVNATYISYYNKNRSFYYLSFMINVYKELIHYLRENRKEEILVITNGPYIYYSLPVLLTKIFHKFKYVCYLICTVDLPQYKGIESLVASLSKYLIRGANATITYVEKSSLDYTKKPYFLLDYQVDDNKISLSKKQVEKNNKIIMIGYTGEINDFYSIELLLDAIKYLPDNFVIAFAGKGSLVDNVINASKEWPRRVKYMGFLSIENLISFQKQCDILIVLRANKTKIQKYQYEYAGSSKIIEYMLSKTPIVTNKNSSFVNNNFKLEPYLNVCVCENARELAQYLIDISKILNSKQVKQRCIKAYNYVLENCIVGKQSKRLCNFLKKYVNF